MNEQSSVSPVPFAFFGTPYVARDTLAILVEAGYVPSVIVTSPDAPRGRGLELGPSETRTFGEAHGIPTLAPSKLDAAFIEELRAYGAQYAVVVAYGKLLPQSLIDVFPLGILNIHYSLLPKYRGASPVEGALLAGETETGVTIQRLALKMDAGDMLAQRSVAIDAAETTGELRARLIRIGAELLVETLPLFISGTVQTIPQNESQATFAGKIAKEEGFLSLKDDPDTNWRKYRAYHESPGTFFYAHRGDKRIRIKILKASRKGDMFVIERIVPESKSEQDYAMLARNGWEAE
ncbi:MAG: methionyl-tRNA formyltransferase [Candidatus Parcubacteria bacterium]|jgi:methionyl-tRNA formyltransferase|nr:methionyl-tRNA formyltransferase [Candidatus Parcubacteria bacterium]